MSSTPVWVWLPGANEPVLAAHLSSTTGAGTPASWSYEPAYLEQGGLPPDPVRLPVRRGSKPIALTAEDGLPGVVRDAMPQGYGADRIVALAGHPLSPLELLERGLPDSVGALEACQDIERKLAWTPGSSADLEQIAATMDAQEPPSRAIRRLNGDNGTSQGGEKPKTLVVHQGGLWLAKMRDRGEVPGQTAREFVTMSLAGQVGLRVPPLDLRNAGEHQVFLIRRFDREGEPHRPQRRFFASAHTVLNLGLRSTPGDPARSYLVLADQLRRWGHKHTCLEQDLRELWQRMAFNALVGNTDDHPRNHGFLWDDGTWRLSPAFDITPTHRIASTDSQAESGMVLAMATGADGSSVATVERLLQSCVHFGWQHEDAAQWLIHAATTVCSEWEQLLRQALHVPAGQEESIIADCRSAFAWAAHVAAHTSEVLACADRLAQLSRKRRR